MHKNSCLLNNTDLSAILAHHFHIHLIGISSGLTTCKRLIYFGNNIAVAYSSVIRKGGGVGAGAPLGLP